MVGTDARQRRVLAAPTSRSAGDHTADRAELHPRPAGDLVARLTLVTLDCALVDIVTSVGRVDAGVYSPLVLRPQSQGPYNAVFRVSEHANSYPAGRGWPGGRYGPPSSQYRPSRLPPRLSN